MSDDDERRRYEEEIAKRDAEIAELKRANELLRKELERLRRELEEWKRGHRQRGKRYPQRSKPVSEAPKRPGRKAGHEGAGRPVPKSIDRYVECTLNRCPEAQGALKPTGVTSVTPVEEIVPARREVVGYRQHEYDCSCGERHWGSLPAELGPAPKLGVRALAFVVSLRLVYRLSLGQIKRFLAEQVGIQISKGGLAQMIQRAATRTAPARTEIQQAARNKALVHMDETGFRAMAQSWWLWFAGDRTFSYFHLDPSRGHEVVWAMLGRDFEGLIACDFMGAYVASGFLLVLCWAHLLREAERVADVTPSSRTITFHQSLREIYYEGLQAQASREAADAHTVRFHLGRLVDDRRLGRDRDVARLQERIANHADGLLRFIDAPQLPPDNNLSERDLRPAVQMRKTMFCVRSQRGADALAHWLSVTQTLHKQGLPLEPFLIGALAAHHRGTTPPSVFRSPTPALLSN